MLYQITYTRADLQNLSQIDQMLQQQPISSQAVQDFFIYSFKEIFTEIRKFSSAIAIPYNCGTVLKTPQDLLVGIDLAMIENYYDGEDWQIPQELYDQIVEQLDLLIVSHGHWDHCWIELMEYLLYKKKKGFYSKGHVHRSGKKSSLGMY